MSRIGDLENAIVSRLASATYSGSPAFAVVRGASGPGIPTLREALRRERTPAAYVAFVKEPTALETAPTKLGAQFVILVAANALRQSSNPRLGDTSALGAFTLIDVVRSWLDDYTPSASTVLQSLDIAYLDADERSAIYELHYRAWPINALAVPAAPESLAEGPPPDPGSMKLVWQAPAESATHGRTDFYRLYKKGPGDSTFKLFETSPRDPTGKTLTAQALGQTVGYYVTALNIAGESAASNTLWVES